MEAVLIRAAWEILPRRSIFTFIFLSPDLLINKPLPADTRKHESHGSADLAKNRKSDATRSFHFRSQANITGSTAAVVCLTANQVSSPYAVMETASFPEMSTGQHEQGKENGFSTPSNWQPVCWNSLKSNCELNKIASVASLCVICTFPDGMYVCFSISPLLYF